MEHEAHYVYYKHGPLARVLVGANQVQGLDYAYTLQGWLKAVNGSTLNPVNDMGQDGNIANQSQQYIGQDAYGFSLHYFEGDYYPINGSSLLTTLKTQLGTNYKGLYNGNISSMAVNIGILNNPKLYNYKYDQLNRITGMDLLNGTNTGLNLWTNGLTATNDYQERSSYDPNGNILTYTRNGYGSTQSMDNLTYNYRANTNKLTYITDAVASGNYPNDIDNQSTGNYSYDSIGNLLTDQQAGITANMTWSVYGKLLTISSKSVSYQYDAAGNRIAKTASGTNTWYVRDAQGNVLSTYSGSSMALQEQDLYGSSRLGLISSPAALAGTAQFLDALGSGTIFTFTRGKKLFELPNHLGNVLATVSDKKFGTQVPGIPSQVSYYTADVKTAQDYYPGGMEMPGRQYNATTYTYSFNGKRDDKEAEYGWQDYGMREYDRRRAQFISVDPYASTFLWNSPYAYAENDVIRSIDLDGLERISVTTTSFAPFDYFGSDLFGSYKGDGNSRRFGDGGSFRISGGVTLNLSTFKSINTFALRSISTYHRIHSPFPDYQTVSPSHTDVLSFVGNPNTKSIALNFQVSGENHAAIYSCDIDDKVDIVFQLLAENQFLVTGIVKGDRFPSNETSITDEGGNSLILGVSGLNTANKDLAPYTQLPGNNNRKMSDFSVVVTFRKDDQSKYVFDKVRTLGGNDILVKDWNKKFSKLDPKSTGTGTTNQKPYMPSKTRDTGQNHSNKQFSYGQ